MYTFAYFGKLSVVKFHIWVAELTDRPARYSAIIEAQHIQATVMTTSSQPSTRMMHALVYRRKTRDIVERVRKMQISGTRPLVCNGGLSNCGVTPGGAGKIPGGSTAVADMVTAAQFLESNAQDRDSP